MLLLDVTYFFSVSDIVFYGAFIPKAVDMHSVHNCCFGARSIYFDVLFTVHVKNDTNRYHDIDRCADHIYDMRSADVVRICISHIKKTCCVVHLSGLA